MINAIQNDRVIWIADSIDHAVRKLELRGHTLSQASWALRHLGEHAHNNVLLTKSNISDKIYQI